ncbi:DUF1206 domain-containing protein [Qipengyuania sp.]|uniref:DUF1206 domain-containing protein n=1 Tax=Qipengyuania sp. TaxID=2004515 RepID=UPI0035C84F30
MDIDKSEKFTWAVRVGYFSRAILYSVLGIIALTQTDRIAEGTNGIFRAIENFPAGNVILWLMVFGLVAYALFRLCSLIFDIENEGSDKKGWAKRIGHTGSAIAHFALAYAAYQFATSSEGSSGGASGGGAQQAASGVLSFEFGGIVLGLLGLALLATGVFQFKKAWTGEFMNRIGPGAPNGTKILGSAGYFARGIVYFVIGYSLLKAGFGSGGSDQIKTLGDAVASLADDGLWFTITAIGLLMFGLFSLVLARYRIIPELDSDQGIPKFRA